MFHYRLCSIKWTQAYALLFSSPQFLSLLLLHPVSVSQSHYPAIFVKVYYLFFQPHPHFQGTAQSFSGHQVLILKVQVAKKTLEIFTDASIVNNW